MRPALLLSLALSGCAGAPDGGGKDTDPGCADPVEWFFDGDGDGYGDPEQSETACAAPLGFIERGADCDDANPGVHPDAQEVCDPLDVDEDCDGLSDQDDPSFAPVPFYADTDEDGHGDPAVVQEACEPPPGFVAGGDDCDDTRGDIHPEATEFCDAADTDEDCDGLADDADDDVNLHGVPPTWTDGDADGWGDGPPETLCDPGDRATVDGDCDDGEPTVNPGAPEVCGDGLDNNCDDDDNGCTLEGTFSAADGTAVIRGEEGDRVPSSVSAGGDLTGDGVGDVVVGSTDAGSYGEAWVFAGPVVGALDPNDAAVTVSGASSDNRGVGHLVLGGWDWNGDGDADLLVGEPQSGTAEALGAAYLFYGPLGRSERVSSADRTWRGERTSAQVGTLAAGGDADGDGADDLVLAAQQTSGRTGQHVLYVDHGPLGSGSGSLSGSAEATLTSDNYVSAFRLGDLDGDGADEILIGSAYEADYAGAAWLLDGGLAGAVDVQADARGSVSGAAPYDQLGEAVALCDLDGDGTPEVLVGAPSVSLDASGSGGVYVFAAPFTGEHALGDARATLSGSGSGDGFGMEVACLGDADGDGGEDLGVGAPYADGGASNGGAAYLFLDGVSGRVRAADATVSVFGDASTDQLVAVGPLDDQTGDGRPEVFVGAPYADDPARDAGVVAVFSAGGI